MQIDVSTTIGNTGYVFKIDEKSEMDALHLAAVLGNPPEYCHVCGNDKYFKLNSNKDKDGNIYVNVVCTSKGCFSNAKLGQYKAGGFFWHKFEKYVPKNKDGE